MSDAAPHPPNSHDAAPPPEALAEAGRVAELAAAFAVGELGTDGLHELRELLARSGEAGEGAARVAWEVISTTTDLRAAMGTSFQDTVRHRLERPDGEAAREQFVEGIRLRLGIQHPALEEATLPPPGPHAQSRRSLLIWRIAGGVLVAAVLVGIVLLAAGGGPPPSVASAALVRGQVTVGGLPVAAGSDLDRRPLSIAPGGRLEASWPAGHRAVVDGPAALSPRGSGVSLSSGKLWVDAAADFTIGLPDMQVKTAGPARLAIAVVGQTSQVATSEGLVLLGQHDRRPLELAAGSASVGTQRLYRWDTAPRWERRPDGSNRLLCDPFAVSWRFAARAVLASQDDLVILRGIPGAPVVGLRAGELILRDTPMEGESARIEGQRFRLSGAPLLERRLDIESLPDGQANLRVTGLDWELPLSIGCPFDVVLVGGARLQEIEFHTGPRPAPPE